MVPVSVRFAWNEDVRMVVGWRCGTIDGDDCGWWCGVRLLCLGGVVGKM